MSHDWVRDAGIYLETIDEQVTARLRDSAESIVVGGASFEMRSGSEILEDLMTASKIMDAIRKEQRRDAERVDEVVRRAREAGEGVCIVQREGRVFHVESSPFVPANTIYLMDAAALGMVHKRLFSDWENAHFMHPNESIIDQ